MKGEIGMSEMNRRDFLKASAASAAMLALVGCGAGKAAETPEPTPEAKKPLKVRAAVCSPTGGTMNATWLLAERLSTDVEMIDQTALDTRKQEITFAKDELAIMSAPSYAGKIPYLPDLFTNLKGDETPCVLVCAYGNRACENNLAQMKAIAEQNGFVVIGAISLITPHVLGAKAGHSRPDLEDHKEIKAFADAVLAKLESGALAEITVEGNPERGEKYESTVEKIYRPENCTHCKACAMNRPAGAIDPETMEIDPALCVHCQRCSHVCLFNARTYAANREGVDDKYFGRKPITYIV